MLPRILSALAVALMVLPAEHPGLATAAPAGTTQFHHIHGLAVDPKDPDVLFVATHGGLLRVIQDRQWEWVGEARHDYMGFTHHPRTEGTVFVSGHPHGGSLPNPMGVLISLDGGQTWRPLALQGQVDFHAMTISADGETLYGWNVMRSPGLYRVSAKDGAWKRLDAAGLRDVFGLAGHPKESGTLLAATRAGLLVSRDGGSTWASASEQLEGLSVTAVAYSPTDPRRLYAYAVRKDRGFITSGDGGKTWRATGLFLGTEDAIAVLAPSPHGEQTIYMATFTADLLKSADGGQTWKALARKGKPVPPS
ncbi:MAG TPA: hypothetical protein VGT06_02400 [Candidatus Methylomirabilis sp.]|jgi:photosystem II stability/assembly factor-like uncharacterized protein|nr:hypothetical protein [Candidatus Methylomirabilis sp.]